MNIRNNPFTAFDYHLPVQNWFYPFDEESEPRYKTKVITSEEAFDGLSLKDVSGNTALYFHIPFCESLCTFCALPKQICTNEKIIDEYVYALIEEIKMKSKYSIISKTKINSIFFGGGTPSLLSPEQILRIGEAINFYFDLSEMKEFSFESSPKTVTLEKAQALRDIGVTHPRIGVQTLNPKYRKHFNLISTTDDVKNAVSIYNSIFEFLNIDIIYGMHGQTIDELIIDLNEAAQLDSKLIDFYPLNNPCSQPKMDQNFKRANLKPLTGMTKHGYNIIGREVLMAHGYFPHNGHGYVKIGKENIDRNKVTTDKYSFQYHESHYGYETDSIIGFGAGAVSVIGKVALTNNDNENEYIRKLTTGLNLSVTKQVTDDETLAAKGLVTHLAYHSIVEKSKINFNKVHPNTLESLKLSISNGLVIEKNDTYELTHLGWQWYVSMLYYLSSKDQQIALDKAINSRIKSGRMEIEQCNNQICF